MTNLVEEAVKVLRGLPDDRQEAAARAIIDFGTDDDAQLSDEQVADIEKRMANPDRKFISLAELDKRIRRLGA